ncbi:MAG: protein of unknown function, DUF490-containing, partial [Deltaproteobacteria bacterium]|nr:protein of unknown function, DUF490-containing [Deltaproteobacteria bacterium]
MRRWLKYGFILFLLLAGFAGSMVWLLGTPGGIRWMLRVVSEVTGVEITAEEVTGRILDELQLKKMKIEWPEGSMQVDRMFFRWQPFHLLAGKISFSDLDLDRVQIQDDRPKSEALTDLTLPKIHGLPGGWGLEVKSFRVSQSVYRRSHSAPVTLENIRSHVSLANGVLSVPHLEFETDLGRAKGRGTISFWEPSLRLDFGVSLKEALMGLNHFSLTTRLERAREPEQMSGPVTLEGRSGTAEPILLETELGLTSRGIELRRMILSQPGQKAMIRGDGNLDLSGQEPRGKLDLKLKDFNLSKEGMAISKLSGDLRVEGTPGAYGGRFVLRNPAEAWRAAEVSGTFQGNLDGIKAKILDGAALSGKLTGEFGASWSGTNSIRARLEA